jgi:uncharacterized membrane protein YqhA
MKKALLELWRCVKKLFSVKLWAGAFCGYELHRRITLVETLGIVDVLLCAGILCFMGINVLQDFIFLNVRGGAK